MATKRGPISSPMEMIPGTNEVNPGECTYDGVSGEPYHKGTPGKIKEVTFYGEGAFGRIPSED